MLVCCGGVLNTTGSNINKCIQSGSINNCVFKDPSLNRNITSVRVLEGLFSLALLPFLAAHLFFG
jgi:hypothetical protein